MYENGELPHAPEESAASWILHFGTHSSSEKMAEMVAWKVLVALYSSSFPSGLWAKPGGVSASFYSVWISKKFRLWHSHVSVQGMVPI